LLTGVKVDDENFKAQKNVDLFLIVSINFKHFKAHIYFEIRGNSFMHKIVMHPEIMDPFFILETPSNGRSSDLSLPWKWKK